MRCRAGSGWSNVPNPQALERALSRGGKGGGGSAADDGWDAKSYYKLAGSDGESGDDNGDGVKND